MARLYLGALLGAMAVGQAVSWKSYRAALPAYGLRRSADPAAVGLWVGEVASAVGLLANPGSLELPIALVAVGVTGAWGALALNAFVRRRYVPNCGCFGKFLSQPLRWWVLLEDVAFVGLALWHLRNVLIA